MWEAVEGCSTLIARSLRIRVGLVLSFNVYIDRGDGGLRLDFRMATGKFHGLLGMGQRIDGAKQSIELPGLHAKIQAHATIPAIYVNVEGQDQADANAQPSGDKPARQPWDRFHIVRVQAKQDKRIVGDIKVAVYGKVSQEQKLVPTTAVKMTGGWVKITPEKPLARVNMP